MYDVGVETCYYIQVDRRNSVLTRDIVQTWHSCQCTALIARDAKCKSLTGFGHVRRSALSFRSTNSRLLDWEIVEGEADPEDLQ